MAPCWQIRCQLCPLPLIEPGGATRALCPQVWTDSLNKSPGSGKVPAQTHVCEHGIQHPKDPCIWRLLAQSDLSNVECKFARKVCLLLGFSPENTNVSQGFPVLKYRFTDDQRKLIL